MRLAILSLALILTPVFSSAHGSPFFEFNPDTAQSLNAVSAKDIYEIFLPQNDFLRGFDLWLENHGSAGPLTLELFDSTDRSVAQKTFIIPTITVDGGRRVHLDFDQLVPIVGNKSYALKISSSLSQLLLYYADRVRLLEYNAPFADKYLNGVANLDSEEKEFSFKFALYESQEHLPPILSKVLVTPLAVDRVRLDFNANEPIDYEVLWGLVGSSYDQKIDFTGSYKFCGVGVENCSANLTVRPGSSYQYQLTAKDSWGNPQIMIGNFETPAGLISPTVLPSASSLPSVSSTPTADELKPPVISNFRVTGVTDKSVEVAWTTNKAAKASLLISFSSELITIDAVSDSTFELEHLWPSHNVLSPETIYRATVTSRDIYNNPASASLSFKTLKRAPVILSSIPSPMPSLGSSPGPSPGGSAANYVTASPVFAQPTKPEVAVNSTSQEPGVVVISWSLPAGRPESKEGYRIDIFNDHYQLEKSINVPTGSHEVKVYGLALGKHQAVVYAKEKGVFRRITGPTDFLIKERQLSDRLFARWPYLAGPLIGLLVLAWWLVKRQSKSVVAST